MVGAIIKLGETVYRVNLSGELIEVMKPPKPVKVGSIIKKEVH